jgi:hypothetical protein
MFVRLQQCIIRHVYSINSNSVKQKHCSYYPSYCGFNVWVVFVGLAGRELLLWTTITKLIK